MDGFPGQAGAELAGGSGGGLSFQTGLMEAAAGVSAGGVSEETCPAGGARVGMVEAGGGKGTERERLMRISALCFLKAKAYRQEERAELSLQGMKMAFLPFPEVLTSAHPVLDNQFFSLHACPWEILQPVPD